MTGLCQSQLGIEDGTIPDSSFNASTSHFDPYLVRLGPVHYRYRRPHHMHLFGGEEWIEVIIALTDLLVEKTMRSQQEG